MMEGSMSMDNKTVDGNVLETVQQWPLESCVNGCRLSLGGHNFSADEPLALILDEEKGLLKQPPSVIILLIVLYTAVFVVAIFNNCLILTVIYK